MKVKENEKVGLKLNIQKTKIMAFSPITSRQIYGETVTDFIFGGSKITADGDCSHEIQRLLGRKVMTNLDSIFKSRDITLPKKVHLVKAMVFSVVMYGCESWTIKKAECWRINAFELWCCRRLLRVPWAARRSTQSILKEISLEYSLEGLMLKWNSNTLATSCEELSHLKRLWCWERLKAGGEGDDRGWDGWMASPTQWIWVWVSSGSWWWTGRPGALQFMEVAKSRTRLSDWTEHHQDHPSNPNFLKVYHHYLFNPIWKSKIREESLYIQPCSNSVLRNLEKMCTIHLLSLTAAHMPKHLLSEVSEKCAGEKKCWAQTWSRALTWHCCQNSEHAARPSVSQTSSHYPQASISAPRCLVSPVSQSLSIKTSVSYPLIWKDPNFSGTKGRKSPLYFSSSTCLES